MHYYLKSTQNLEKHQVLKASLMKFMCFYIQYVVTYENVYLSRAKP